MPWPVYLALRQIFPRGRIITFSTLVSVAGVALGVALILVANSVMTGFGHRYEQMIVDTQGEIQVRARGLIKDPDEIGRLIDGVGEVAVSSPFAEGFVMIEYRKIPAFPQVLSVNPQRIAAAIPLDRYLIAGKLADLDDDSVILSSRLAADIGVYLGETVDVYTPLMLERAKQDEVLLPIGLRVAGVFEIGHQEFDRSIVICTLRRMQDLYGLEGGVHGFNVRLKPGADLAAAVDHLEAVLPASVRVLTWMEANAEFQAILAFERNMLFFLLTFIIIVAAFSMTGSMLVTVVRKTREIGLLGAMGGCARDVALAFCVQGTIVGLCGTAIGLVLGFMLLHFRNAIVEVIARVTVGEHVLLRYYQFTEFPAHTELRDVAIIVVFAMGASMLAGIIPAWRAARLRPVEALRSE
jgi:lipoprotein-releasing system permease protein